MNIKAIWIEAENWSDGEWTPIDDNTNVIVTLDDDSEWVATFFTYTNINTLTKKNKLTGECLSGKFFSASEMVLIDKVTRSRIKEVVTYLVNDKPLEFLSIFRRIEENK